MYIHTPCTECIQKAIIQYFFLSGFLVHFTVLCSQFYMVLEQGWRRIVHQPSSDSVFFLVWLICPSIRPISSYFFRRSCAGFKGAATMESLYNDDPLNLQPADHPGLQLISLKLTSQNFQRWSKSVRIALRTKVNLVLLMALAKNLLRILHNLINGLSVTAWF